MILFLCVDIGKEKVDVEKVRSAFPLFLFMPPRKVRLLTETMGKEEEEKERDSTAKNSCRSAKEAPPRLTFCGVGAGRLRFTCAI